ncbi:fibronectin type III domain-containing protein [uncultured Aquimarina sp.]|uniref:fibronectin type III domain-containing protein n=1 Tax=uncultured Aquimarina sp. TaxID=575652 RepID=UPI0026074AF0|nr:fibronectin type III domain-containing protein [uncultured Aquimarina sp.]
MKKLITFVCISCMLYSCSESDIFGDGDEDAIYNAPNVRSYTTYTSQNAVSLNGFINHENVVFQQQDTYTTGFIFRTGDAQDSSNDQIIELEGEVEYYNGFYKFNHTIDGLTPNTTYHYTAFTKNGPTEETDWESFTTSAIACTYDQDNYYSISGTWRDANVEITNPSCCGDGNVGFRFGIWPDIFQINFNELSGGYPKTGQYFGVDYEFKGTHIQRELVKSTNQVLIDNGDSTPETELFVNNDGQKITLIFCDTQLRNGGVLNGKVSAAIPTN